MHGQGERSSIGLLLIVIITMHSFYIAVQSKNTPLLGGLDKPVCETGLEVSLLRGIVP